MNPTEKERLEIEILQKLSTSRTEDLKFADAKAAVILTLSAGICGWIVKDVVLTQPSDLRTWLAFVCLCSGFLFTLAAVSSATFAIRPRIDGGSELAKGIPFGGPFNGAWTETKGSYPRPDMLSAAVGATYECPQRFLRDLNFIIGKNSEILATHCIRAASNVHVKYRYIRAASTLVALEACCLLSGRVLLLAPWSL